MLYKLLVLGNRGVGKTALIIQLCLNRFVETYDPSLEDSYRKQVVIDEQPCILEILDAGQEEYEMSRDMFIRDADGILLVYSVTSRSTFESVERFRDQIVRVKGPEMIPFMLVGNKYDQITEREVSREEGMNMARRLGCKFVESSAKICVNVEMPFYTVVRMIRAGREGGRNHEESRRKRKCLIL